jgi:hypothetical protein
MSDWEKTIIPLNDAHEIFAVFGIESSSREYQRWRREDGFRHVDFEGILDQSSNVLGVDWREWLRDSVDTILGHLDRLGISATADLDQEGEQGILEVDGQSARIKYIPAEEDDFDRVIAALNPLISARAQYRKFRSCEGSDGWWYAVLLNEDWERLDSEAGETTKLLFTEIGSA